jgi:hypothetical protein
MAATLTRRGGTEYAPPRNDAYVVLLIISLVAMILGCALLYFDYSSYPDTKPPTVTSRPAATAPAGGAGGGQQGGAGAGGAGGAGAVPPGKDAPPPKE